MIRVRELSKTYRVPVKKPGFLGSFQSIFSREYKDVHAVSGLSFDIEAGERVGFLGPNGAGKTTTLKMLAGLLYPTAGSIEVGGHRPQDRARAFLERITLVMGQKQQLLWDLPARESFELNRAMYGVERGPFKAALDELVTMLRAEPLLDRPVRNLSLGERMKCELIAALVHRPQVLFLDEPTIGLDVEMQVQVRQFIAEHNRQTGATVLLTSHYMQDIAALTPRLLIIDGGKLRYDGALAALAQRVAPERRVVVRPADPELAALGFVAHDGKMVATVPSGDVNRLVQRVLSSHPLADIGIEDPPLEEVIGRVFREAVA
ncbi:MAG: ATP-binding cassette domain-containing protein [Deltaproteobacteria bacterium]|nr:ATP-binding cassette domain-containing protein [Deltaproteobacteria bacterium]